MASADECSTPIQAKHESELKHIREKLDMLVKSVCGNGEEGLKIRVDRLEHQTITLESIDEKLDHMKLNWAKQPAICAVDFRNEIKDQKSSLKKFMFWLIAGFFGVPGVILTIVEVIHIVHPTGGP